MTESLRLYRRQEGDLVRSGKMLLEFRDQLYDLTEALLQANAPVLITALFARDWFEPNHFENWLDQAAPRIARPLEEDDVLLPPLLPIEVGKILALGKNFRAHAEEFREEVPSEPIFFNKLPETLRGHNQEVSIPAGYTGRMDHEVELAVIIGKRARNVREAEAYDFIAGFSIANDLTLRSMQGADREQRHPWFRCKNFDGSCPLGPCFALSTHLSANHLDISAHVNGELRQSANTEDLVTSVTQAVSYLSQHMTLNPGDIVLMGTPAGVGPLVAGDEVVCSIGGIGKLRTKITSAKDTRPKDTGHKTA